MTLFVFFLLPFGRLNSPLIVSLSVRLVVRLYTFASDRFEHSVPCFFWRSRLFSLSIFGLFLFYSFPYVQLSAPLSFCLLVSVFLTDCSVPFYRSCSANLSARMRPPL